MQFYVGTVPLYARRSRSAKQNHFIIFSGFSNICVGNICEIPIFNQSSVWWMSDFGVPMEQTAKLHAKLLAAGVQSQMHVLEGAGHGGEYNS